MPHIQGDPLLNVLIRELERIGSARYELLLTTLTSTALPGTTDTVLDLPMSDDLLRMNPDEENLIDFLESENILEPQFHGSGVTFYIMY